MEQHEQDQQRDYGTMDDEAEEGQHPTTRATRNQLDMEERIATQPLDGADDEVYPIYDSEDEDDDLEEAKRVGGWTYAMVLARTKIKRAGEIFFGGLKHATPMPKPTEMPNDQPSMGVPKNMSEGRRFKAPKGKRELQSLAVKSQGMREDANRAMWQAYMCPSAWNQKCISRQNGPFSLGSSLASSSAPSLLRCSTLATTSRLRLRGRLPSSQICHCCTVSAYMCGECK